MAAAVIDQGKILFVIASGLRDREAKSLMTPETEIPAASVSKLFTAALVMRQVERGRLTLDTPVNNYVPAEFWVRDAKGNPAPSTLRQLLSHSSGLPVSWAGIALKGQMPLSLEQIWAAGKSSAMLPDRALCMQTTALLLRDLWQQEQITKIFCRMHRECLRLCS